MNKQYKRQAKRNSSTSTTDEFHSSAYHSYPQRSKLYFLTQVRLEQRAEHIGFWAVPFTHYTTTYSLWQSSHSFQSIPVVNWPNTHSTGLLSFNMNKGLLFVYNFPLFSLLFYHWIMFFFNCFRFFFALTFCA